MSEVWATQRSVIALRDLYEQEKEQGTEDILPKHVKSPSKIVDVSSVDYSLWIFCAQVGLIVCFKGWKVDANTV